MLLEVKNGGGERIYVILIIGNLDFVNVRKNKLVMQKKSIVSCPAYAPLPNLQEIFSQELATPRAAKNSASSIRILLKGTVEAECFLSLCQTEADRLSSAFLSRF